MSSSSTLVGSSSGVASPVPSLARSPAQNTEGHGVVQVSAAPALDQSLRVDFKLIQELAHVRENTIEGHQVPPPSHVLVDLSRCLLTVPLHCVNGTWQLDCELCVIAAAVQHLLGLSPTVEELERLITGERSWETAISLMVRRVE